MTAIKKSPGVAPASGDVKGMTQAGRTFYRLTSEGRTLWSRRMDIALPEDYRRVLGLVDFCGYHDVIRGYLGHYPERVVDAWLTEFQTLGLIEMIVSQPPQLAELFSRAAPAPPLEESDQQRIAADAKFADISLARLGAYVSHERVANRLPAWKAPKYTHVVVVEDDPDQRALAVLRLTAAGYPVHAVENVAALTEFLHKRRPDTIFLDVMLPDGDGFDVLAALRQHPLYALLPVVMVTAKTEPEHIARGLALGADGYVTKPYGERTLDYVLRYVLQQEVSEASRPPAPPAAVPVEKAEKIEKREKVEKPIPVPKPQAANDEVEELKTLKDVHALITEVAVHREVQQSHNVERWRTIKRIALLVSLFLAVMQFYMMDTLSRIESMQPIPVFAPVTSRDLRSFETRSASFAG